MTTSADPNVTRRLFILLMIVTALFSRGTTACAGVPERIVCLGDSITDGHTYPLLVQQALREAGKPVPIMIGAGIGGDNGAGMLARLDRDVFAYHPDRVMLSDSINDAGLSDAEYEKAIRRLLDRFKEKNVRVTVLTSTTVAPMHADIRPHLAEFNDLLHKLAIEYGCTVADVNARMAEAPAGQELWEPHDGVHLNFAGYRLMARAVLDALGDPDVEVPKDAKIEMLPGILRDWRIKALADDAKPLDDAAASSLAPDATWKSHALPETEPLPNWWRDHQRQRGVGMQLAKSAGMANTYLGIAVLHVDKEKEAFLNTGADLRHVWLNGKRLTRPDGPAGWHPGRERIKIQLQMGDNIILVETGATFFVSITEDNEWG